MERVKVALSSEQALFLHERAAALNSTPDELISALLDAVLMVVGQGDEQSVQERFVELADHYGEISKDLFVDDPDLCLDAVEGPGGEDAPSIAESDAGDEPAEVSAPEMSETEVQRAFGKLADRYEEISREVFGGQPPLSADLPDRHIYAVGIPISGEPGKADRLPSAVAKMERFLDLGAVRFDLRSDYIVHMQVPAGEQIVGPALVYLRPQAGLTGQHNSADS